MEIIPAKGLLSPASIYPPPLLFPDCYLNLPDCPYPRTSASFLANVISGWNIPTTQTDQSDISNFKKCDLQIAKVTLTITDGVTTGSSAMTHRMGVTEISIGTSQVYKKYIHYVNQNTTGYSSDKETITASANFDGNKPYLYNSKYYYIINGSASFATTSTGIKTWSSFTLSPAAGSVATKTISPTATYTNNNYYYETWAYSFKNSIQSTTVTKGKKYFYEVWGACGGGYGQHRHPEGGYSCGFKTFSGSGNQTLYIVTGGRGKCCYDTSASEYNHYDTTGAYESYNGGGKNADYTQGGTRIGSGCSAGGATHIGLKSGLLTAFKSDYSSNLLVVAGGGGCNGGAYELLQPTSPHSVGGGTNGADCRYSGTGGSLVWAYVGARGASAGSNGIVKGTFGQGASGNAKSMGSGGGGFMGGNSGVNTNCPGGGGSAYIGGLDSSGRYTLDGNSEVPAPGGGTQHGNGYTATTGGHGYAMISLCPVED